MSFSLPTTHNKAGTKESLQPDAWWGGILASTGLLHLPFYPVFTEGKKGGTMDPPKVGRGHKTRVSPYV